MRLRDARFWLTATTTMAAAVAFSLAIVALTRSGGGEQPTPQQSSAMTGMTSMGDHMAAAPSAGVPFAVTSRGGRRLAHSLDGDTWVFRLTAKPVKWEILPGKRVTAWTYNGTVPGPEIRVPYGQRVRVVVKNELPESTAVHWHGLAVPNSMDGVPGVTQQPIGVGKTSTYSFRALPAGGGQGGTFFYHSHLDEDRQVGLGLAAPLIIVPPNPTRFAAERTLMLAEWNFDSATGATRPPMDMQGLLPNYFTINGKSYPATEPLNVRPGQRVLLRFVGAGQFAHPMHLHGTAFTVLRKDGHALPQPYKADVVDVAPGERFDVSFTAPPGRWVLHCHIGHHLTNDGASPGGLLMIVNVGTKPAAAAPATSTPSRDQQDMSGMDMPGMDMGSG